MDHIDSLIAGPNTVGSGVGLRPLNRGKRFPGWALDLDPVKLELDVREEAQKCEAVIRALLLVAVTGGRLTAGDRPLQRPGGVQERNDSIASVGGSLRLTSNPRDLIADLLASQLALMQHVRGPSKHKEHTQNGDADGKPGDRTT